MTDVPDQVAVALANAVSAQVGGFLDLIPPGMEPRYGFAGRDQFSRVVPGTPFRVLSVEPERLWDGARENLPLQAGEQYRVLLMVDGRARAMLTMEMTEDGFRATDLGAAGLARELDQALRARGLDPGSARPRGLLRLHVLKSDFLVPDLAASDRDLRVIPLQSARSALGLTADTPEGTRLDDIAPVLKRAAAVGMDDSFGGRLP